MPHRLRILSARSGVLLIVHRTRVGVVGGTGAVGNTPAVQADDAAAAAADGLHRQGASASGAAARRRGCRRRAR